MGILVIRRKDKLPKLKKTIIKNITDVWFEGSFIKSYPKFIFRSSRPEVFCKKGVLRNFAKFTVKHLWQRLFFNKVSGLCPATLLKKNLWHRCFPVNFVKFLRTPPSFTEHLRWMLLYFYRQALLH